MERIYSRKKREVCELEKGEQGETVEWRERRGKEAKRGCDTVTGEGAVWCARTQKVRRAQQRWLEQRGD